MNSSILWAIINLADCDGEMEILFFRHIHLSSSTL